MRVFAILFTLVFVITTSAFVISAFFIPGFEPNYASSVRAPLFSGLLTVGSFLLALKTTILQRMKDAFDSPDQEAKYTRYKEQYPARRHIYYFGLYNMSMALSAAIFIAFIGSAMQLTVGFFCSPYSVGVCLGTAATCFAIVLYLWLEIAKAHRTWLENIENVKQRELNRRSSFKTDQ